MVRMEGYHRPAKEPKVDKAPKRDLPSGESRLPPVVPRRAQDCFERDTIERYLQNGAFGGRVHMPDYRE